MPSGVPSASKSKKPFSPSHAPNRSSVVICRRVVVPSLTSLTSLVAWSIIAAAPCLHRPHRCSHIIYRLCRLVGYRTHVVSPLGHTDRRRAKRKCNPRKFRCITIRTCGHLPQIYRWPFLYRAIVSLITVEQGHDSKEARTRRNLETLMDVRRLHEDLDGSIGWKRWIMMITHEDWRRRCGATAYG